MREETPWTGCLSITLLRAHIQSHTGGDAETSFYLNHMCSEGGRKAEEPKMGKRAACTCLHPHKARGETQTAAPGSEATLPAPRPRYHLPDGQ